MPEWMDQFLFWDLVVVVLLCFSDWMIGAKQRARMREQIGHLWLYLDNVAYSRLAMEDAKVVVGLLDAVGGTTGLAPKRLFASCLPSLIFGSYITYSFIKYPRPGVTGIDFAGGVFIVLLVNCAVDWASWSVTASTLRAILQKPPLALIMANVLLVLLWEALFSLASVFLLWWAAGLLIWVSTGPTPVSLLLLVIACSKMAPAASLILYGALLFGCKALRALLKWPIGTIALRLHESKQGVLSQLAAAGGVLAKIVHEATKVFST